MAGKTQNPDDQNGSFSDVTKEILLKDYDYFSDSFWKNEQVGETRVNLYIGFVTFVLGALGALLTSKDVSLGAGELQLIILGSLFLLLVLGTVTFLRILIRNSRSDGFKKGLNDIRLYFKEQNPSELLGYSPFGDTGHIWAEKKKVDVKKNESHDGLAKLKKYGVAPRKFGGLAHTVAAINSIILAMLVVTYCFPVDKIPSPKVNEGKVEAKEVQKNERFFLDAGSREKLIKQTVATFFFSFFLHVMYARRRDLKSKNKLKENWYTHAGGVVVQKDNGTWKALLVRSSDGKEWVLPKGKIKEKEGVIEAAVREVKEEGEVCCRVIQPLGRLYYKKEEKEVRVRIYLMKMLFKTHPVESRQKKWMTFDEFIADESIYPGIRELINLARVMLEGKPAPGTI
ncbi:MAG: NUDIX domain-containing protein [Nanoarchaeota archaeon]